MTFASAMYATEPGNRFAVKSLAYTGSMLDT